jgi:quercetin dioxygenase-like cupin family protein
MQVHTWAQIKEDALNPLAGRKALHGKMITLARFRFDKGNQVAMHHHANDQITTVESGSVRFFTDKEEMILKAGDMVLVPPDVPHGNEALEDTIIVEIFSPVRQDWITGDDSYLRRYGLAAGKPKTGNSWQAPISSCAGPFPAAPPDRSQRADRSRGAARISRTCPSQ